MKKIRLFDYPELRRLCWHRQTDMELTEEQAHKIYTRNWRHLNQQRLTEDEAAFIARLRAYRLRAAFEDPPDECQQPDLP
ncbi:hypothetical protein [Donghicola mangrovi]|uniref:Uncharacterized protein n=1 Tax=Donghicola mangrovi TaxID=2729614 RepID=A0A850QF72_9RHOB|nr:hypothetical protein [Donghicola mangrovi]NVO25588.1 hypothetical protein [Donghicola mangrovi]